MCSCNANEVLAFLQNSYIQKYKLYLQLHKKIKPKGKGETENLLNLRSLNTRLKHFYNCVRKEFIDFEQQKGGRPSLLLLFFLERNACYKGGGITVQFKYNAGFLSDRKFTQFSYRNNSSSTAFRGPSPLFYYLFEFPCLPSSFQVPLFSRLTTADPLCYVK